MSDRFPFPANPTGWYRVALASDVRCGELTPLSWFGRELVAFRTDDGGLHVTDAHCPHLGAHLAYGGCVEDGLVVCPFHGWRFDTEGRNVEIPDRAETNGRARLRTFEARDWCGLAMVWFDEGGAGPTWQLPDLPEAVDDDLCWHAPPEARWRIRTHPQEVLENAVDIAHFRFVHGVSSFGALTLSDEGPMLRSMAELTLNTPRGPAAGAVENELWGLGVDVNRIHCIGRAAGILTLTPIDGEHVDAVFVFLSPQARDGEGLSPFALGHVRDTIVQVEADIPIWEHKVHRVHPSLARGEGAILDFRRWAAQFYPATAGA